MTLIQETRLRGILTLAHTDYEKALNKHAFFKVSSHIVGEDLVQETFLKTWTYLVKGGEIETMKAFLYHVLNNLIIDQYRKRKTVSLDVLREYGFEPSTDPSIHLFNFLDGARAIQLISQLPKSSREIMQMKYIQHLSAEDMSLATGKSKNAIAVQSHRGLAQLKVLYQAFS